MDELTTAFLLDSKQILPIINNDIKLINENSKPYFLVIVSTQEDYTKLTIYPINFNLVVKIIIKGCNITQKSMEDISEVFKELGLKFIHTSGIVYLKDEFVYEIYIIGNDNQLNIIEECQEKIMKINCVESFVITKINSTST